MNAPLFPNHLRSDECVNYSCYSDNLKAAIQGSGLPKIASHCHRVGFSSEVVQRGVKLDSLELCRLWHSQESVQPYILRDPETRLIPPKRIGF